MLCLDGGGIRGLVQLEILRHVEELTHRKITDLFDWIVGTSTGGIIALGLVYGTCVVSRMLMRLYESGVLWYVCGAALVTQLTSMTASSSVSLTEQSSYDIVPRLSHVYLYTSPLSCNIR